MDPYDYDAAVIRAAETLTDKSRAFRNGDSNADPEMYLEALEKALEVRRQVNEPKATATPSLAQAEVDRMRPMVAHVLEGEPMPSVKPTPSITVGTQVRLTGVVGDKDGDKRIRVDFGEDAEDEWAWIPCKAKCLEVIRQPFKRGEVVYFLGSDIPCVVVEDESNDKVLLTEAAAGKTNVYVDATQYTRERRP